MTLPDNIEQGLEDGRVRNLRQLTAPDDFNIFRIAERLAKINRFAGATWFPLSVATHSVVVSRLCPPELAMTGLLHDITESFGIGDLISPVKSLMPGYRELEHDMWQQLCVPFPALRRIDEIEPYDKRATAIEALVHRGSWPEWASVGGYDYPLTPDEDRLIRDYYEHEIYWRESASLFVRAFGRLGSV